MPNFYSSDRQRSKRTDYDETRRPRQTATAAQHEAPRGSAPAAQSFALVHLGPRNPHSEPDGFSDGQTHPRALPEARHRHSPESSQDTRTSSHQHHERGNRAFKPLATSQISYSGITAQGNAGQMNGSIGEAQLGSWSNIHAGRNAGPQLNGGIRGSTRHDVEAAEVALGNRRNHGHESRHEQEAGCGCVMM